MQFNTAIARMMEFVNALSKYMQEEAKNLEFLKEVCTDFVKLLAHLHLTFQKSNGVS